MHRIVNNVLMVAIVTAVWPIAARSQSSDKPPAGVQKDAAQAKAAPTKPAAVNRFELKDGDRVVFIGNTFFEREGRYGYIEAMLTTRYPGKRTTFRNLGWSGDTVWGESRGYFEPEKGYQNLINLVAELKPTVIFLAYGNNEAFAGEQGLEPFIKQYNKLLDDLERFTKRIVIIGPTEHQWAEQSPNKDLIRERMNFFHNSVRELARVRGSLFIDVLDIWTAPRLVINSTVFSSTENGVHGNATGYWRAGNRIWPFAHNPTVPPPDKAHQEILIEGGRISSGLASVRNRSRDKAEIAFELLERSLPLPIESPNTNALSPRTVIAHGMPAGDYRLLIDGEHHAWATAEGLSKGVWVIITPEVKRVEQLRKLIIEKNQLFFHRWRPQNTTYLLGFRKHEQGQNAKEIAQFDPLIAAKEEEIFKLAQPVPHKYELIRVKEKRDKDGGKPSGGTTTGAKKGK